MELPCRKTRRQRGETHRPGASDEDSNTGAHADMSDKISTFTTLIWRLIMLDSGKTRKLRLLNIFAENDLEDIISSILTAQLRELIVRVSSSDLHRTLGHSKHASKMLRPYACRFRTKVTEYHVGLHQFLPRDRQQRLFKSSASCPNCRKIVNDGCANTNRRFRKKRQPPSAMISIAKISPGRKLTETVDAKPDGLCWSFSSGKLREQNHRR